MGLCRPSGKMQKGTPCASTSSTSAKVSMFLSTLWAPSRMRAIGTMRMYRRNLAMAGFLKMSARAPKTVGSLRVRRTIIASISVLVWFGAMITAPSLGSSPFTFALL